MFLGGVLLTVAVLRCLLLLVGGLHGSFAWRFAASGGFAYTGYRCPWLAMMVVTLDSFR